MAQFEYKTESSLTAPEDRNLENRWRPEQGVPKLEEEQVSMAMNELNVTSFTDKFPRVDRTYADPQLPMQTIGLISWVPAKGAQPNQNGVYGFAKMRGNFATEQEASQRAEYLIREVDSYHHLYHAYVGRPIPMTSSSKFSAETEEVDIRKQMTESISSNIKESKKSDQKEMKEIQERQEKLIEDTEKDHEDPYDQYITLRVKKAQLTWTYLEHHKKMKEMREVILKARRDIAELDTDHPDFQNTYYEKYMKARRDVGFKDTPEEAEKNFLQFLVEDVDLPGIDVVLHIDPHPKASEELEQVD
jgi:hypothetical protein